jgi:hypothetical protein
MTVEDGERIVALERMAESSSDEPGGEAPPEGGSVAPPSSLAPPTPGDLN